jgi:hypothetical protein
MPTFELASQMNATLPLLAEPDDVAGAFDMTRGQHQDETMPLFFGALLSIENRFFFPRMRASPDDHRVIRERTDQIDGKSWVFDRRVEFQIARDSNAFLWNSERDESLGIEVGPSPDRVDSTQRRAEQPLDALVSREGSIRKATGRDDDRDIVSGGRRDPEGPEFGLDQHRQPRTRAVQSSIDEPWMIEGGKTRRHLRKLAFEEFASRGGRGGRTDRVAVRLEFSDQPRGRLRLTDARSVDLNATFVTGGPIPESIAKATA